MLQINQIKLPIQHSQADLETKIRKILKLSNQDKFTYKVLKQSIDARKKPELFYVYSCGVQIDKQEKICKIAKSPNVSVVKETHYELPKCGTEKLKHRPLIIGAGPAGLFAAYTLCLAGFRPILIERGKTVEERTKDVEEFWKTGVLNTGSNVQFGEGGAGTFSDGKLNTVVKDPMKRNAFVLETLVKFGALEAILYENKPHIGTDILCKVIANLRNYLLEHGTTIYFNTRGKDFIIKEDRITQVICEDSKGQEISFDSDAVVLALGHSSRDTFRRLYDLNIPMEVKNFAVGFRVEHPQEMMNLALYGQQDEILPAAPYKVTANFPNKRGVYSFCMCPGGYVVNSSSEEGGLVVNGMSYSGRNSSTANSAIIVSVGTEDFKDDDALAGMRFQEQLERKAFALGQGKIVQQLYGDYCKGQASQNYGEFVSNTKGQTTFANLRGLLSEEIEETFIQGMEHFAHIIPGFNRADAILSGVESRTSSPLRILRNEEFESSIKGIYPCGEGAGYAGGITSAAMDGVKVAEAIIKKYGLN